MNAKRIAEKIAALLSKTTATGATEAEALAAAKMAQRLMAKYHVSSVDIDTKEAIGEEGIDIAHRWEVSLAYRVAKNFCCEAVKCGKQELITGKDRDRDVAIRAIKMFLEAGRTGLKQAKREARERYGTTRGVESSYGFSFANTVANELAKEARALMLIVPEEVTAAYKKNHPHTTPLRTYWHGNRDAMSLAKNRGEYDGRKAVGSRRLEA